jgi:hypothetical protein
MIGFVVFLVVFLCTSRRFRANVKIVQFRHRVEQGFSDCCASEPTSMMGVHQHPVWMSTAAPLRMCLRNEDCGASVEIKPGSDWEFASIRVQEFCSEKLRSQTVFMLWMTSVATFSVRNQLSLESLLRHHPCVHVRVIAPLLPHNLFDVYIQLGYNVTVEKFDEATFEPFAPAPGDPGHGWVSKLDAWRMGPHFAVHKADMLRMLILYREGGSYIDFDHIVLRPMLHIRNGIGSEVCQPDNPDCLDVEQLEKLDVAVAARLPGELEAIGLGEEYSSRVNFHRSGGVRYTPCNGVLINWVARHSLFGHLLRVSDGQYSPDCWGCLGPRLWGAALRGILSDLEGDGSLFTTMRSSFGLLPPAALYPFDYTTVAKHMRVTDHNIDRFLRITNPLGVHFFSGISAKLPLVAGSTMHKILGRNTLSATDPDSSLHNVLLMDTFSGQLGAGSPNFIPQPVGKIVSPESRWSAPLVFETIPKEPAAFAERARRLKVILLCPRRWSAVRHATARIAGAMAAPVLLVERLDVGDVQNKIELLLRAHEIAAVLSQSIIPGIIDFAALLRARRVASVAVVHHGAGWVGSADESTSTARVLAAAQSGVVLLAFVESGQAAQAQHLAMPVCALGSTFKPAGLAKAWARPPGYHMC